jgi:hypothetical protein
MKFVSHLQSGVEKAAVLHDGQLYNVAELNSNIPSTMLALLQDWDANLAVIKSAMASVASGDLKVNTLMMRNYWLLCRGQLLVEMAMHFASMWRLHAEIEV